MRYIISTCHWCHVMERECFEDDEVAQKLNEGFVSIKVDREERPDIDSIYMTVCQSLTGHGGWPLSVFMTPQAKPFYAGTYFPRHDRYGIPGFLSVVDAISREWNNNREKLVDSGEKIAFAVSERKVPGIEDFDAENLASRAFDTLSENFDREYGGFGSAPKFPSPHNLMFLLRYWRATGSSGALSMVEKTLEMMYRGGIFDHIGFGFSRYSTDRQWLVPHFEKMLYDNALLAVSYTEAFAATKRVLYRKAAENIFTYVLRDMTSQNGAFFSAEDADSEGVEGKFYLWTVEEVLQVLDNSDGAGFCSIYDITHKGNFEGRSIPNLVKGGIPEDTAFVEKCRQKLFDYRQKRVRPFKDDKILVSWNSLMTAALAIGGRVFGNPDYIEAAEKAAEFMLSEMTDNKGRLMARYREGSSGIRAYSDDYAFLVWALLELYACRFKPEYLEKALHLNDEMLRLFRDEENGGLYLYGIDSEQLIARPKVSHDGALPSANSVAAANMLRLALLTGRGDLEERSHEIFKAFSGEIQNSPAAFTHMLSAVLFSFTPTTEIVIVENAQDGTSAEMLEILNKNFLPFTSAVLVSEKNLYSFKAIPYLRNYHAINGKTAAYVCRDRKCSQPVTDISSFEEHLLKNTYVP